LAICDPNHKELKINPKIKEKRVLPNDYWQKHNWLHNKNMQKKINKYDQVYKNRGNFWNQQISQSEQSLV